MIHWLSCDGHLSILTIHLFGSSTEFPFVLLTFQQTLKLQCFCHTAIGCFYIQFSVSPVGEKDSGKPVWRPTRLHRRTHSFHFLLRRTRWWLLCTLIPQVLVHWRLNRRHHFLQCFRWASTISDCCLLSLIATTPGAIRISSLLLGAAVNTEGFCFNGTTTKVCPCRICFLTTAVSLALGSMCGVLWCSS